MSKTILYSALWGGAYPFINFFPDFEERVAPDYTEVTEPGVLVVWGGGDIWPGLYNHRSIDPYNEHPTKRDKLEWGLIQFFKEKGWPMIGVCRGAQMMCAAAGGSLYQHVNNHSGQHNIITREGDTIRVNSIHHQMMNPENTEHEMIAWSENIRSDVHMTQDGDVPVTIEPEFIYFNKLRASAIQWHPEMMAIDCPANKYIKTHLEQVL